MYETIILAVCLTQTPAICKEVNISSGTRSDWVIAVAVSLRSTRTDGNPEVDRGESHVAR